MRPVLWRFGGRGRPPSQAARFAKAPEDWRTPQRWREIIECLAISGHGVSFVWILAAALCLGGCARQEERADVVIVNGAEPDSLDPAMISTQPEMRLVKALFEGLTRLEGTNGTAVPALAERWDITPDGKIYTFHLRSNLVWSSGQAITAEDFVWTWKRAIEPATGSEYASQFFFIVGAEDYNGGKLKDFSKVGIHATDPLTLRVELNSPTAFFLDLCAFPTAAAVPRFWIEKYGDRWLLQPGLPVNGAFLLEYWHMNDRVRLRKNPRHWDAVNTRSEILDFLPVKSAATALNLYETGEADIIWDKNLVPTELMDVLKQRPDCHLFEYLGTYFYRYNVTRKPFDDVRVRKALAFAVNRKQLVAKVTRSGEKATSYFTPNGIGVYQPPPGLEYDPEMARRLLAEAGYPGGKGFPPFHYLLKSDKADEQVAVELQAMWQKELGIHVELRQKEPNVYYSSQSALDYDLSRSSWIGDYNDPNTFLGMFTSKDGNNRTGWASPAYDTLIRTANEQTDPVKRAAILHQAEVMLIQEAVPIMPLYFYAGVNFFDPNKIEGVNQNLLDEHPVNRLGRKGRESRVEGREPERSARDQQKEAAVRLPKTASK